MKRKIDYNYDEERMILNLEHSVSVGLEWDLLDNIEPVDEKGITEICASIWGCSIDDFIGKINHNKEIDRIKKVCLIQCCRIWSNLNDTKISEYLRVSEKFVTTSGEKMCGYLRRQGKFSPIIMQVFSALDSVCAERFVEIDRQRRKHLGGTIIKTPNCKMCSISSHCPILGAAENILKVYCPKPKTTSRLKGVPLYCTKEGSNEIYEKDSEAWEEYLLDYYDIHNSEIRVPSKVAITTISGKHLYYKFHEKTNSLVLEASWEESLLNILGGIDKKK